MTVEVLHTYAIQQMGRERERFLCEDCEQKKVEITPIFYWGIILRISTWNILAP